MNRREALSSVGLILGGTIIGSQAFLTGCTNEKPVMGLPLNARQKALLNEISEAILPKTESSPGAKEVDVASFMSTMVHDYYSSAEQKRFLQFFNGINGLSEDKFGKGFIEVNVEEKESVIGALETDAGLVSKDPDPLPHYYIMIKQLAIWGYTSSELVATTACDYVLMTNHEEYDGSVQMDANTRPIFREPGEWWAKDMATHHINKTS